MGSLNWAKDTLNQEFRHLHGDPSHQNRSKPDYLKKKKITGKLGVKERDCCEVPKRKKQQPIHFSYENVIH